MQKFGTFEHLVLILEAVNVPCLIVGVVLLILPKDVLSEARLLRPEIPLSTFADETLAAATKEPPWKNPDSSYTLKQMD